MSKPTRDELRQWREMFRREWKVLMDSSTTKPRLADRTTELDAMLRLIDRVEELERDNDSCANEPFGNSCDHARRDHVGGKCTAGVEGDGGWITCACEKFVDAALADAKKEGP